MTVPYPTTGAYRAIGDEEALFRAAHDRKLPVVVKGPTGCGKTRLVDQEYLRFSSWDALRGDLAPLLRSAIRASR